jgi:hypothetical protein
MKHYKLSGWPELPAMYRRIAYRRMLHQMSQRPTTIAQLVSLSSLPRTAVLDFLQLMEQRGLVVVSDQECLPSRQMLMRPLVWFKRALAR